MIKAIIFDVGGVLVRTADHSSRRNWEKKLGLAAWESETIVFNSAMGQKAQRGEISDKALWAWVDEELNLGLQFPAFQAGFWAGDVLDTALIDYIRRLHTEYQTAIISNATDNLLWVLTEKYQIANAFDLIVGSAYEKIMKPDPRIYQLTLERLGRNPQETVFIDDFAHNISTARELGMAAIHFQPDTDVVTELAALGVPPQEV